MKNDPTPCPTWPEMAPGRMVRVADDGAVGSQPAIGHAGPGYEALALEARGRVLEVGPKVEGRTAFEGDRRIPATPANSRQATAFSKDLGSTFSGLSIGKC